ncbi:MAG: cache domain-containing protein [Thermoplasmata archaeon]
MMAKMRTKLIVVFLVTILVPVIILQGTAEYYMSKIGKNAAEKSHDALHEEAEQNIQQAAQDKAESLDRFFEKYYAIVAGLCEYWNIINSGYVLYENAYIHDYYPDKNHTGLPGYGYIHPEWGCYADFDLRTNGSPYINPYFVSLCLNDTNMSQNISVSLHKAMLFDVIFRSMYKENTETLDLLWIVLVTGATSNAYPPYNYTDLISSDVSLILNNETDEDYVVLLNETNNPRREIKWLSPYFDITKRIWMVSCITPLYEGDTFAGTAGVDILLETITKDILNFTIGNSSYAFILDSNGMPVALPEEGIKDFLWNETLKAVFRECIKKPDEQNWTEEKLAIMEGFSLKDTSDGEVKSLVLNMTEGKKGIVKTHNEEKLIAYAPIKTVGWSLGIVLPHEEVIKPAEELKKDIDSTTKTAIILFGILLIIILIITIILAIFHSNSITRNLMYLTAKANDISKGKGLDEEIKVTGEDEIIELAKAFQRMVNSFKIQMSMMDEDMAYASVSEVKRESPESSEKKIETPDGKKADKSSAEPKSSVSMSTDDTGVEDKIDKESTTKESKGEKRQKKGKSL